MCLRPLPDTLPNDVVIGLRYCQAKSGGLCLGLAFSAAGSSFCQAKVKEKINFSTLYVQLKFLRAYTLEMSITIYGHLDSTIENNYIQGSMDQFWTNTQDWSSKIIGTASLIFMHLQYHSQYTPQ